VRGIPFYPRTFERRKKMKKYFILLLFFSLILFSTSSAFSTTRINFGIKSLSLQYHESPQYYWVWFDSYSSGYVSTLPSNQILGCYLGFDITEHFVMFAGLDYTHKYYKYESETSGSKFTEEESFTQLTPNIGFKLYLKRRDSREVCPYFLLGFFKTYASVDKGATSAWQKANEELTEELNSPWGFFPAFGAEYFFSNHFSLGGEAGLRFSFADAGAGWDETVVNIDDDYSAHYIGFTVNFRF
jgi:hypothetical protein